MSTVFYVILAILVLSVLIVLHELGHYLMGKWLGFGIVEFAIGMGPVLFRKKGKETDFVLRAFLIGGSCRFYGEDEGVSDAKSFNAQKVWKRFLVVLAGPLMNVLTALVLAFVILLGYGQTEAVSDRQLIEIAEIAADSAAADSELETGDILLAVNGTSFSDFEAFKAAFDSVREDFAEITVLRGGTISTTAIEDGSITRNLTALEGGEERVIRVEHIRDRRTGNNLLGVSLMLYSGEVDELHYNVLTAAAGAFPYCWDMTRQVYSSLWGLLTGKYAIREMSGVVGTVSAMSQTMEMASAYGLADVIYVILALGTLISINFAVVNLLPFPALDGGRLVFIILEMLRGKPIDPEKEGVVHFVGMLLLLVLIAVLLVSDILKLF